MWKKGKLTSQNRNGEIETETNWPDKKKDSENENQGPAPPDILTGIVDKIKDKFEYQRLKWNKKKD